MGFFTDWLVAFPDAYVVCEDALATGTLSDGTLVGRFTYLGTFTNPIFGIPPTAKRVVMRSIDIWRVREGRLVEHWDELNTADWFAQLQGAEPQRAPAPPPPRSHHRSPWRLPHCGAAVLFAEPIAQLSCSFDRVVGHIRGA